MRSFWSDPYLWVHLAGLAAVPIFLEICLIGFAVGDPLLPGWLELFLVAAIGIAPILWMQWQRPFYIFSLVVIALPPEQLTEDQRRLLTLFKSERNRIAAAIVPLVLFLLLSRIYQASPFAVTVVASSGGWRLGGLLLATIGFLGCNLFTQVPVSVAGVMLHSDPAFATTNPYPLEQIRQGFSLIGLPVRKILPTLLAQPEPIVATAAPAPPLPVEPAATASPPPPLEGATLAAPAPAEDGTPAASIAPELVEASDAGDAAALKDDIWGD